MLRISCGELGGVGQEDPGFQPKQLASGAISKTPLEMPDPNPASSQNHRKSYDLENDLSDRQVPGKIIKKLIAAKRILEVFEFQGHREKKKQTYFKNIQAFTKNSY